MGKRVEEIWRGSGGDLKEIYGKRYCMVERKQKERAHF
jgi:hypothetical protein